MQRGGRGKPGGKLGEQWCRGRAPAYVDMVEAIQTACKLVMNEVRHHESIDNAICKTIVPYATHDCLGGYQKMEGLMQDE